MSCQPRGTKRKNDRKYYNLYNDLNYIRVLIGSFIIIMIFWRADAYMTSPTKISALYYKTDTFYVTVGLFSNKSEKKSKCSENICDTLGCLLCAAFLFLPHYDVICDLLLNKRTATRNLSDRLINMVLGQVL